MNTIIPIFLNLKYKFYLFGQWRSNRWLISALLALLLLGGFFRPSVVNAQTPEVDEIDPQAVPLLAYYYIWFDPSSWNRAKTDYPLLGRYASDDTTIMQQHIRWAKRAGLDGFIVSWKSTDKLNNRLEKLIEVADAEDFKLAIIYQGLDFERNPLAVEKIAADLAYFNTTHANKHVFNIFGKPLYIWSGTWKFSQEEIASVAAERGSVYLLASEKNVAGYERIAELMNGNAYYWSSVNPDTYPNYPGKLLDMANLIHEHGGYWIAPAAPGFDAREIGGTRVIERDNGKMLITQLETAWQSTPDAVGLISWNEFSENSHVEPSEDYGSQSLEALAYRQGLVFSAASLENMASTANAVSFGYGLPLLVAMGLLFTFSVIALVRRSKEIEV